LFLQPPARLPTAFLQDFKRIKIMAMQTQVQLTSEAVATLQKLIQYNFDSRDGFRHAAESIEEIAVANMFRQLGDERDRQALELQSIVINQGEAPKDSGSLSAAAHRTWMDLRTALGGGLQSVLDEAERGEDYIKNAYEEALREFHDCPACDVLERQYIAVKAAHDRVRDMRDAHAEEK
jgi:uncharacterized protein (TIGR02284 family)